MPRETFAQIFDAPAETVVAYGRVVFTLIAVAAIAVDPTKPAVYSNVVQSLLTLYACYSIAVLAALHWRIVMRPNAQAMHAVDLLALSTLTALTEGIFSPFLVLFSFVLVAAAVRWDWRGVGVTMLLLVLASGTSVAISIWHDHTADNLNQFIIRLGYLVVMAILLGYLSARRDYQHQRLTAFARWHPAGSLDRSAILDDTLKQAAAVFAAHSTLAMWQTKDRPWEAVLWQDGRCECLLVSDAPPLAIPSKLKGATFSRTTADPNRLNLIGSTLEYGSHTLMGELVSKIAIGDFASAPLEGAVVKGRLFVLGNIRASDDHLFIARVVADRVAAELDRLVYSELTAERLALRERENIARDLHDGLLQNLTAARAHLELIPADGGAAVQLQTSRELLRTEQLRIRQFVQFFRASDDGLARLDGLRPLVEETARTWDCVVELELAPKSAQVSRRLLNHLSLMLAEAIANAVRHGEARSIWINVRQGAGLDVEVRDDGRGFPCAARSDRLLDLTDDRLPQSLRWRAADLGGRLRISSSRSGTTVYLELPL